MSAEQTLIDEVLNDLQEEALNAFKRSIREKISGIVGAQKQIALHQDNLDKMKAELKAFRFKIEDFDKSVVK